MSGDMFNDAFAPNERIVPPNSPMNLFREPTLNKYHVGASKDIGEIFQGFIEGVCSAVSDGISQWMKVAMFTTGIINGPVCILPPGSLVGPPLGPLVLAGAPKKTPQELKYSSAVSNGLGTAWLSWHSTLTGQLMYPMFAAVPSPVAPPMPNIPMPLIAFASPGEAQLSPAVLKSLMETNLADPTALHASEIFDAIAKAFNNMFQIFKASTIVTNVLGTGPVPTFAPPFVPVGPVLGGTIIPTPGHLV